jgi:seryl-tRNA synthetase
MWIFLICILGRSVTMLDITLLRTDQGGDPEVVRLSQTRRYAKPEHLEDVIQLDAKWRKLRGDVDNLNKEYNAVNKQIAEKKKAKEECDDLIAQNKAKDAEIKVKDAEEKEARSVAAHPCTRDSVVHPRHQLFVQCGSRPRAAVAWQPRARVGARR